MLTEGQKHFPGQATTYETCVALSGFNAQGAIIPFGYGVVFGATDDSLVLPSATGFKFAGIAKETNTIEKRLGYSLTADDEMGWPVDLPMSFYRRGGEIAVPVDSDCEKGDPVYLIHTASAGQVPGHFRKDANTAAADLVPNAIFWKTLTAAGLGIIRLNCV